MPPSSWLKDTALQIPNRQLRLRQGASARWACGSGPAPRPFEHCKVHRQKVLPQATASDGDRGGAPPGLQPTPPKVRAEDATQRRQVTQLHPQGTHPPLNVLVLGSAAGISRRDTARCSRRCRNGPQYPTLARCLARQGQRWLAALPMRGPKRPVPNRRGGASTAPRPRLRPLAARQRTKCRRACWSWRCQRTARPGPQEPRCWAGGYRRRGCGPRPARPGTAWRKTCASTAALRERGRSGAPCWPPSTRQDSDCALRGGRPATRV